MEKANRFMISTAFLSLLLAGCANPVSSSSAALASSSPSESSAESSGESSVSSSSSVSPSSAASSASSSDVSSYEIVNGDLETGDLTGWTIVSGTAFAPGGVSSASEVVSGVPANKHGSYFYDPTSEAAVGELRSSSFIVGGACYATFLLGAGYQQALTYLSLVDASSGLELARYGNALFNDPSLSGSGSYHVANLNAYKADLRAFRGHGAYFLLVDSSTANYGYLTFDDIVTYYTADPGDAFTLAVDIKPVFPDLAGTPNVLYNETFATQTLAGWTVIGEDGVFRDSDISSSLLLSNRPDESKIGVLRSSAFKVGGSGLISLRLGATKHRDLTYLSIKEVGTNAEVFRTWSSRWKDSDEEKTHLYDIDLYGEMGKALYLEFVDNSRSDWGLLTIEAISTYDATAPAVTDEEAVNLLEPILSSPTFATMRSIMSDLLSEISDDDTQKTVSACFYATLDGVSNSKGAWASPVNYEFDGSVFVYTGDIAAMWLRDSSVQFLPYLRFTNVDPDVKALFKGLLRKQFEFIRRNPYANAFNADGSVYEKKFEIDSLVYPLWLASRYYDITGDGSVYDAFYLETLQTVLTTLEAERNHNDANYAVTNATDLANSQPSFDPSSGLIWSGYRPSDDVTYYKFNIPDNMFAVAAMENASRILNQIGRGGALASEAAALAASVRAAIETYGVYLSPIYGKIYAFETDGSNSVATSPAHKLLMDAANVPSLLSAPWLGYCAYDDATYLATRSFALSSDNPYYYVGTYGQGIGDPHDQVSGPAVWPLAIAMEALTSLSPSEIQSCLASLVGLSGGTYVMHEAVDANDPSQYSRDFFTWPCALYADAYLSKILGLGYLTGLEGGN
jgi:meiotically up-regulated gene 157 (Mug157) protein